MGLGLGFRSHADFVTQNLRCKELSQVSRNSFRLVTITLILMYWIGITMAESPGNIDVSGKWKGTRATSGPGTTGYKVQSISFNLTQSGETITGSYRCHSGKASTDCPSPIGRVTSGTIRNRNIEIKVQTLPNAITCSFGGKVTETNMNGTYSCYAGGSLSTIGTWKAQRE
jgi:hypothetical protein